MSGLPSPTKIMSEELVRENSVNSQFPIIDLDKPGEDLIKVLLPGLKQSLKHEALNRSPYLDGHLVISLKTNLYFEPPTQLQILMMSRNRVAARATWTSVRQEETDSQKLEAETVSPW